jgi:hypothetical protein
MAARRAGVAALKAQEKGFTDLRAWIKGRMQRIVVITDRPFWYRSTFLDELITQTIEYVAHIAPTIVIVLAKQEVKADQVYADVDYVCIEDEDAVAPFLAEAAANCSVSGAIVYVDTGSRPAMIGVAAQSGIEEWTGGIVLCNNDYVVQFRSSGRRPVTVSPLRYAPASSENTRTAHRVALFRPTTVTDWETATCDFIARICRNLGLQLVHIEVPALAEYSAEFLLRSMTESAARVIVFERTAAARLFLCQANQYRDVARLMVGEGLSFPDAPQRVDNLPSLASSIVNFLTTDCTAQVASGANTGWEDIWEALERPSRAISLT